MSQPCGIIVIDGPDAVGKTTLGQHFVDHYGAKMLHQTYHPDWNIFDYHTEALVKALYIADRKLVILDRLWLSEAIYGSVYRGGSKWPHQGRMVDRVLMKHGALNIVATGDPEVVRARHAVMKGKRSERFDSQMDVIARAFNTFWKGASVVDGRRTSYADDITALGGANTRQDYLRYDIGAEGKDIAGFAKTAIARLELLREWQPTDALSFNFHNFAGRLPGSKFVFVGDQPNPKYEKLDWPFYDYGNCSLYLAAALHRLNFDERLAVWLNINVPGGTATLLDIAGERMIVALGYKAAWALSKLDIPHTRVDHPQFARRFKFRFPYEAQFRPFFKS